MVDNYGHTWYHSSLLKEWSTIHVTPLERTVKISNWGSLKLILRYDTISIRIQADPKTEKLTLKLIWKFKGHRRPKAILKNNKVGGLILPNFKTVQSHSHSVVGTVIKDPWSQVESPEINLYINTSTNFQKGCQDNLMEKKVFPKTGTGKIGYPHAKEWGWLFLLSVQFSSVQSLSRVQLCDPMNHRTPGLPVHHH